jgi:hypothetical protein
VCGVCGGVGGVGVWGLNEQSRPTPYVRHSTDCTCCDFGHLRFLLYCFAADYFLNINIFVTICQL